MRQSVNIQSGQPRPWQPASGTSRGGDPTGRVLQLLTNFADFPKEFRWRDQKWACSYSADFPLLRVRKADLIIVNCEFRALAKLACAGCISRVFRKPVVAVDVVLRRPKSALKAALLRAMFSRIGHFVNYFRDLREYQRFYGIGHERSTYVPFKPNLRYRHEPQHLAGEYVLCFGQSMRDYDTFFQAMDGLPIPGAISEQTAACLKQGHAAEVRLPPSNIQVLADDFSQDAQIRILENACIVALPVRVDNICASGIGTYLNSMLLGKAVIMSAGPGVSDVLTDGQVYVVPPGDGKALREAIELLWKNERLRSDLADRGRRYAESLGGEPELVDRVREAAMRWYHSTVQL